MDQTRSPSRAATPDAENSESDGLSIPNLRRQRRLYVQGSNSASVFSMSQFLSYSSEAEPAQVQQGRRRLCRRKAMQADPAKGKSEQSCPQLSPDESKDDDWLVVI